jgi:hypothetical protein
MLDFNGLGLIPGKAEPGVWLASMRRVKEWEFKAVAMIIERSNGDRSRLERISQHERASGCSSWHFPRLTLGRCGGAEPPTPQFNR